MPRRTNKVIISCALTGGIHTPTMSPALPVSPDMLAEQGIAAAQAGAAILHVHARDARDGRPTPDPVPLVTTPSAKPQEIGSRT